VEWLSIPLQGCRKCLVVIGIGTQATSLNASKFPSFLGSHRKALTLKAEGRMSVQRIENVRRHPFNPGASQTFPHHSQDVTINTREETFRIIYIFEDDVQQCFSDRSYPCNQTLVTSKGVRHILSPKASVSIQRKRLTSELTQCSKTFCNSVNAEAMKCRPPKTPRSSANEGGSQRWVKSAQLMSSIALPSLSSITAACSKW